MGRQNIGGIMGQIINLISIIVSVYMMIIVARIILTWFQGSIRIPDFMLAITDPYLNWFRQFRFLRIGFLDLTPVAALAVLTILNQVLGTIARFGTIRLGIIMALFLQVVWSAASFFLRSAGMFSIPGFFQLFHISVF